MNSESHQAYIKKRQARFRTVPIDGQALKSLIVAGLTWLRTNQEIVNSLNVYPVPDGDTGINMVLTMQAAYNEIAALQTQGRSWGEHEEDEHSGRFFNPFDDD
jgi:hypothetical protein